MGKVTIQSYTTKNPITMIGEMAGICYNADTDNPHKNYKRGIECLENEHGRTIEYPSVHLILDGYSAKVIREWYTHIGCLPSRLQESTRYVDYQHGFNYVTPSSISKSRDALRIYASCMNDIALALAQLDELGVPREDSSMLLPLGMTTKIVDKRNLRNLIDMSHQRLCRRAYHEYRTLMMDICEALSEYSEEWEYLVKKYFVPKCIHCGYCNEKKSCGLMPKKEK